MTIFLFSQNLKNKISKVKKTSLKGSQKHEAFLALELHSWFFVKIKYNLSLNCNNADKLYYNNYYLIFDLFYLVLFRSLSKKQKLYPFPVKDVLAIKSKIEENNVSDGTPPLSPRAVRSKLNHKNSKLGGQTATAIAPTPKKEVPHPFSTPFI